VGHPEADFRSVGQALDPLAAQLGVSREEIARGIIRIANDNVDNALKLLSLSRGIKRCMHGSEGPLRSNARRLPDMVQSRSTSIRTNPVQCSDL